MSLPFAFWDTSALIPLCARQKQTEPARMRHAGYEIAVWWATPVEIISGLTRLERMNEINRDQYQAGMQRWQSLAKTWDTVRPSATILDRACSLLELHPLRAADALQLAAALDYFEYSTRGNVFITADQRLADSARQSGFSVEFL
jgi:predicted nucleic acid-binding protein